MLIKIKALRSLSWTFFHSSPCVCTKEEGSLLSHVDELAKRKIWPHSKLFTDALAPLVKRPLWALCVIAGHTQSYTSLWEPYLMVYCSQDTVWLFTCPCPWPHSFFFLPGATFPKPISPVSSYPYFKTQLQHHFLPATLFLIAPLSLARLGALCLYPHITGHFSRPECSLHCLIMVSPPPPTVLRAPPDEGPFLTNLGILRLKRGGVMVNIMYQFDQIIAVLRYLAKRYFSMCLWGCLWMRLASA